MVQIYNQLKIHGIGTNGAKYLLKATGGKLLSRDINSYVSDMQRWAWKIYSTCSKMLDRTVLFTSYVYCLHVSKVGSGKPSQQDDRGIDSRLFRIEAVRRGSEAVTGGSTVERKPSLSVWWCLSLFSLPRKENLEKGNQNIFISVGSLQDVLSWSGSYIRMSTMKPKQF